MNGERKNNITSLSGEKHAALAERNGWSLAYADGLISGQTERQRGSPPTSYLLVGTDDYALGFRAGYFERRNPDTSAARSGERPVGARLQLAVVAG